ERRGTLSAARRGGPAVHLRPLARPPPPARVPTPGGGARRAREPLRGWGVHRPRAGGLGLRKRSGLELEGRERRAAGARAAPQGGPDARADAGRAARAAPADEARRARRRSTRERAARAGGGGCATRLVVRGVGSVPGPETVRARAYRVRSAARGPADGGPGGAAGAGAPARGRAEP